MVLTNRDEHAEPYRCADCKAVNWPNPWERHHAARVKCASCGSLFLDRIKGDERKGLMAKKYQSGSRTSPGLKRQRSGRKPRTTPEGRTLIVQALHRDYLERRRLEKKYGIPKIHAAYRPGGRPDLHADDPKTTVERKASRGTWFAQRDKKLRELHSRSRTQLGLTDTTYEHHPAPPP